METLVRMHEAAGAREIVGSGLKAPDWTRGEDLEAVHRGAPRARDRPREFVTFSAHQMGTLPDGPRPAQLRRQPLGRTARHAGRVDRRRLGLPERLRDEPDGDDHGSRSADCVRHRERNCRLNTNPLSDQMLRFASALVGSEKGPHQP